jgi:predicted enzyme related to lactoylglutathione lyase
MIAQMKTNFILYVKDQDRSTAFYKQVLGFEPTLNVPGMTEFKLGDGCVLGLMGEALPDPASANGIPRAEIYLTVDDPSEFHRRSIQYGGKELSLVDKRNWGDIAGYTMDLDGHVLAFAKKCANDLISHTL